MFIRHEGGFGSVRVEVLDTEALAGLGYVGMERAGGGAVGV
jgi:hypothetical protein